MTDGIKRGQIYYIGNSFQEQGSEQRAGRPAIIVSNDKGNLHSPCVTVVYLTTQPKNDLPTHIDIRTSNRPSVALCEQISTISKDRLTDYVGTCTAYEMQMIDAALLIALSIDLDESKTKREKENDKVVQCARVERENVSVDEEEKTMLIVERDTYKHMYEALLDKIIHGRITI